MLWTMNMGAKGLQTKLDHPDNEIVSACFVLLSDIGSTLAAGKNNIH